MLNTHSNFRDMSLSVDQAEAATPSRAELESARSGSVVAPLPHLAALKFSGEDAESFLQGQLTCDVAAVRGAASWGAYCSPQGRMLASVLLWRIGPAFFMVLAADIAAGVQQRLARFVLRARVKIEPAGLVFAGCSGAEAPAALRGSAEKLPEGRLEALSPGGDEALIRL